MTSDGKVLPALAFCACCVGVGCYMGKKKRAVLLQQRKSDLFVRIPRKDLLMYTQSCLEAAGSTAENAATVAEVLVEADLRGITSHGVNRLELYCSELSAGNVDPAGVPRVVHSTPCCASVDGGNAQGAVVGKYCMDLAIKMAKDIGVGWVVAHRTNHYGIAGYYTMLCAKQGLVGMSMTNTSPTMFPTRSAKRAIGTNPIAFSAPCAKGDDVTVDLATTVYVKLKFICERENLYQKTLNGVSTAKVVLLVCAKKYLLAEAYFHWVEPKHLYFFFVQNFVPEFFFFFWYYILLQTLVPNKFKL
eukprot:GSMAST32.ASY1.ANO1.1913.1 assembled CDS